MISSVEGILAGRSETSIVVETGGFGFEIHVPATALASLGNIGERVRLSTYLHVREDALTLFGFATEYDRGVFMALLGVSGVGPKAALAMMSAGSAAVLAGMIRGEDVPSLVRIPGIGKKTAERIILELKDKIEVSGESAGPAGPATRPETLEEAVAALMSIGLTRNNAERALDRVDLEGDAADYTVEDIVRMALRKVPH
ncbi:MAG: Holliday junction branch migration protein RuvA [Candidatus Krumholzibacteria bacterium]|nr:Holliday junction branch migration protein RuvA [Candidatus Krumholzibacteria bacterium]